MPGGHFPAPLPKLLWFSSSGFSDATSTRTQQLKIAVHARRVTLCNRSSAATAEPPPPTPCSQIPPPRITAPQPGGGWGGGVQPHRAAGGGVPSGCFLGGESAYQRVSAPDLLNCELVEFKETLSGRLPHRKLLGIILLLREERKKGREGGGKEGSGGALHSAGKRPQGTRRYCSRCTPLRCTP